MTEIIAHMTTPTPNHTPKIIANGSMQADSNVLLKTKIPLLTDDDNKHD